MLTLHIKFDKTYYYQNNNDVSIYEIKSFLEKNTDFYIKNLVFFHKGTIISDDTIILKNTNIEYNIAIIPIVCNLHI